MFLGRTVQGRMTDIDVCAQHPHDLLSLRLVGQEPCSYSIFFSVQHIGQAASSSLSNPRRAIFLFVLSTTSLPRRFTRYMPMFSSLVPFLLPLSGATISHWCCTHAYLLLCVVVSRTILCGLTIYCFETTSWQIIAIYIVGSLLCWIILVSLLINW